MRHNLSVDKQKKWAVVQRKAVAYMERTLRDHLFCKSKETKAHVCMSVFHASADCMLCMEKIGAIMLLFQVDLSVLLISVYFLFLDSRFNDLSRYVGR